MTIQYTPRGVCSRAFTIQVEDGVIQSVQVVGGCHGNLQGISSLLRGMPVDEAVRRMEGIRCGNKPTSCPDQIAQALNGAARNFNLDFLRNCRSKFRERCHFRGTCPRK